MVRQGQARSSVVGQGVSVDSPRRKRALPPKSDPFLHQSSRTLRWLNQGLFNAIVEYVVCPVHLHCKNLIKKQRPGILNGRNEDVCVKQLAMILLLISQSCLGVRQHVRQFDSRC